MTLDLFDDVIETHSKIPNPLLARDPELVARLDAFRAVAGHHLLIALMHQDRRVCFPEPPAHARDDAQAVAVVLSVLVRPAWTRHDLDQFDAYWRTAWRSELFGDEFEADRFCIQDAIRTARRELTGNAAEPVR